MSVEISTNDVRTPDSREETATGVPKVEFSNICVSYFSQNGEVEAVQDLALQVRQSEFVAIVGQSGCGKSTLLSLVAGILKPTSGEVKIDGRVVDGPSPMCGYMLQQDNLFEWRTILDNVLLGAEMRGLDMHMARQKAIELLQGYGLADFTTHYPDQLSGGMRQRVALARTLCTNPEILLLDEPFSALDFQTRLALSNEVSQILRNERKTVVLVTHDIAEAVSVADRVVVISKRPGRVKAEHKIDFPSAGDTRPNPFDARNCPEFTGYFNQIWDELEIHIGG